MVALELVLKHAPQGLPNQKDLEKVLAHLDKEYDIAPSVNNKTRFYRDSSDAWKEMARAIRKRHIDDAAPVSCSKLQLLVDNIVVVDIDVTGFSNKVPCE